MFKRKMSALLAVIMILTSMVGGFSVGAANELNITDVLSPENINLIREYDLKNSNPDYAKVYEEQKNEKVRILVEVDKSSVLDIMSFKGSDYEALPASLIRNVENEVSKATEQAIYSIEKDNIELKVIEKYAVSFSGFAAEVESKDIEAIKNADGIKNVYISQKYILEKPTMVTSHEMINDSMLWNDLKYKGEGTIVAVIDSGTDVEHVAMVLSDETKPALEQETVNDLIAKNKLPGKYYTSKVPYGYNYFDGNYIIKDLGPSASEHGMHVAGTVAANGELLKGVAPEAQILGMKVFGNDPLWATTYDDIYLKAIEDAIILGADVLNMSLGSPAGFDSLNSLMNETVTKAVKSGIVCAIAAGNESHIYYGYFNPFPFERDPDYGVVGTPSVYEDSISVASINNAKSRVLLAYYYEQSEIEEDTEKYLPVDSYIFANKAALMSTIKHDAALMKAYKIARAKGNVIHKVGAEKFVNSRGRKVNLSSLPEEIDYYDENGEVTRVKVIGVPSVVEPELKRVAAPYIEAQGDMTTLGEVEFANAGLGNVADFTDDVKGKVALIKRGALTFTEKCENAEAAGAIGVIIYNHENGGDELPRMQIAPVGIPVIGVGFTTGTKMLESPKKLVEVTNESENVPNPNGGLMSDFSSMGPTPMLRMKPELTAPGGGIYSTLNDNKYGMMSGTSMATPHVAGGSALIQQYLKDKYPDMGVEERTRLVKTLLMNTATIVKDENQKPYAVRKQGAGLMNLSAAVTTPAYVTTADGKPKVELNVAGHQNNSVFDPMAAEAKFNVKYVLKSLGEAAEYEISAITLSEKTMQGFFVMEEELIDNNISGDTTVKVAKNGMAEGTVSVTIPTLKKQNYVEGWLVFTDKNDTNPQLILPFLGFYGDWDGLRIFDEFVTNGFDQSKYEIAMPIHLYTDPDTGETNFSGPSDEVAFSPGTIGGQIFGKENVVPVFTLFRNAENLKAVIKDTNDKPLRTIITDLSLRKNYNNSGRGRKFYLQEQFIWDGTSNGKDVLPDGTYKYELQATSVGGSKVQNVSFTTMIDTKDPIVKNLKIDTEKKVATFTAYDNDGGSGLDLFILDMTKVVGNIPESAPQANTGVVPLKKLKNLGNNTYEMDISKLFDDKYSPTDTYKYTLLALDDARNFAIRSNDIEGTFPGTSDEVLIYLPEPDLRVETNNAKVKFEGFILTDKEEKDFEVDVTVGDNLVKKFTRLQKDGSIELRDESGQLIIVAPGYRFSEYVTFNAGYSMAKFSVRDANTKEIIASVQRAILVDTIPPVISNVEVKQIEGKNDINVTMTVKEQQAYFDIMANGSHVKTYDEWKDYTKPEPVEVNVEFVLENVDPSTTELNILVKDIAGNKQTKKVKIDIVDTGNIDKRELEALLEEFKGLDKDEYIDRSKEYIAEEITAISDLLKSDTLTQVRITAAVEDAKAIKKALVKKSELDQMKLDLQEKSTLSLGVPKLGINPQLEGPLDPVQFAFSSAPLKKYDLGSGVVVDFPNDKEIKLIFFSVDGFEMFEMSYTLKVDPVAIDDVMSLTYVSGRVKQGAKALITGQVYNAGKPVKGVALTVEVYDNNGEKIHSEVATTNDRGQITVWYQVAQDATVGIYRVQLTREGYAPVAATFEVVSK